MYPVTSFSISNKHGKKRISVYLQSLFLLPFLNDLFLIPKKERNRLDYTFLYPIKQQLLDLQYLPIKLTQPTLFSFDHYFLTADTDDNAISEDFLVFAALSVLLFFTVVATWVGLILFDVLGLLFVLLLLLVLLATFFVGLSLLGMAAVVAVVASGTTPVVGAIVVMDATAGVGAAAADPTAPPVVEKAILGWRIVVLPFTTMVPPLAPAVVPVPVLLLLPTLFVLISRLDKLGATKSTSSCSS